MAEHKSLAAALAAFQGDTPTLPKDGLNPHFKSRFTPLDTIVETVRPLLAKHGLAWAALPGYDEQTGHPVLEYLLIHAGTGEELQGRMPLLLQKQDPQGLGSALTYARRYALSAVLNLVADEDDDGNTASRPAQRQQPAATNGGITEAAAKHLGQLIRDAGKDGEWVRLQLAALGVDDVPATITARTLRALTSEQAKKLADDLTAVIAAREVTA